MKNNTKFLIVMFTLLLAILSGCGNLSDETTVTLDNQSQNNNSKQNIHDDSSDVDSTDSTDADTHHKENHDLKKKPNTSNDGPVKEEDSSVNQTEARLKEEYLKKINDTKKDTDKLTASDSSTYALKKVENDRWVIWDDLLNEIYGVLKEQLPAKEMGNLREEQRNWLKYRDNRALEASQKYKGGTQEHLEYVAVLADLTKERCYELVAKYMK